MEGIGFWFLLIVGWYILKAIFSSGDDAVSAESMGPFQVRLRDTHLNDDGTGPPLKEILAKGLAPVTRATDISFVTSVFDKTDGELEPVISAIDMFQEEDSVVYQHSDRVGTVKPDHGYVDWVRVGVVIPDVIVPPYGGTRNLIAIIRIVDNNNPPNLSHGYHDESDAGIIWQASCEFTHTFEEKGYKEASEHRDEATGLSLRIGMAVAMADGSLDDTEGTVLQDWVRKSIAPLSDDQQTIVKEVYNTAMRESYEDAKNGDLVLSDLTERLNEIGEKATKYEAIELCFEVMAADGVADTEEVNLIRKVAESLDLDMDEVNNLRDQQIVGLDANISGHASIEDLLGIDMHWSDNEIKKYLRTEFQKWNNRLNTLPEGDERANAQLMLDRIAEARKKYA